MLELHRTNNLDRACHAEVHVIACGDLVIAGLSGEIFTRLGQTIRAGAPDRHVLVAASCNGVVSYIATHEDVAAGGYASHAATKLYGFGLARSGAGEAWAQAGAELVAGLTRA
jgi:hypothetical protein